MTGEYLSQEMKFWGYASLGGQHLRVRKLLPKNEIWFGALSADSQHLLVRNF